MERLREQTACCRCSHAAPHGAQCVLRFLCTAQLIDDSYGSCSAAVARCRRRGPSCPDDCWLQTIYVAHCRVRFPVLHAQSCRRGRVCFEAGKANAPQGNGDSFPSPSSAAIAAVHNHGPQIARGVGQGGSVGVSLVPGLRGRDQSYPRGRSDLVTESDRNQENLEFDPKAASDLAETRSIASTDMLATGSAVTPPPFYSTDGINSTASISKSGMAERSTDNLLRERSGSVEGFGSGPVYPIVQRRHRGETDSISGAPLLDYAQPPWASHSYAGSAVEVDQEQSYPPTAFARPVMPRADSAMSHQSDRSGWSGSGQDVTQGYQQAYGYQQPRYQ